MKRNSSESVNQIEVFESEQFGKVRAVAIDKEPWLVGKDVAERLGYSNPRDALARHVDEEDKNTVVNPDGNRGNPNMTVINESGLYSLVLSSKLPKAKQFKHWVTSEVLPSIRKHGMYATTVTLDKMLGDPDFAIRLFSELKAEREKNEALTAENQVLLPKGQYYDDLVDKNALTNFTACAKELHVPPRKFTQRLVDCKLLFRDKMNRLMPYQQYVDKGWFQIKDSKRGEWAGIQTLVTTEGKREVSKMVKDLVVKPKKSKKKAS